MSDSSNEQQEPKKVATPEDDRGGDIALLRCAGCGKHPVSIGAVHPTFISTCAGHCELSVDDLPVDSKGEQFVVCSCCEIVVRELNKRGHKQIDRAVLLRAWKADEGSPDTDFAEAVADAYVRIAAL